MGPIHRQEVALLALAIAVLAFCVWMLIPIITPIVSASDCVPGQII
jgi:hypothetical protein